MLRQISLFRLSQGKFWVGSATDDTRWLREYPIQECLATHDNVPGRRGVIEAVNWYIQEHGEHNVRGGHITGEDQSWNFSGHLYEKRYMRDLCTRCGRPGHVAERCYARLPAGHDITITDASETFEGEFYDTDELRCERCERIGHHVYDCYAKTLRPRQPWETPRENMVFS